MEENYINDVDYSNFLDSLQQSNLDIYNKVDEILTYNQNRDKLQYEKELKEKQDLEEKENNEKELKENEDIIDYNSMFHEELIKIESNTQYCNNLEYLESINNLLISIVLFLGIILGILSFNSLARFFKW